MAKNENKVRYQVLGKVFVNGSLIDPKGRKDVFVDADPGLEGTALKLAPERGVKAEQPADNQEENIAPDDGVPIVDPGEQETTVTPLKLVPQSQGKPAKKTKKGGTGQPSAPTDEPPADNPDLTPSA